MEIYELNEVDKKMIKVRAKDLLPFVWEPVIC